MKFWLVVYLSTQPIAVKGVSENLSECRMYRAAYEGAVQEAVKIHGRDIFPKQLKGHGPEDITFDCVASETRPAVGRL